MDRYYNIKISPENIISNQVLKTYSAGTITTPVVEDPCCVITATTPSKKVTGYAFQTIPMSQVVTGNTNGTSLMTGLTIPILLTETTMDVGYYSVFDGAISQQDVFTNFIFSGSNINQYEVFLTNTSLRNKYNFLNFSNYVLDWGDGTIQTVSGVSPFQYSHVYPATPKEYTISLSGISPWNVNLVQKTIILPYSAATIPNPQGTAYFIPLNGSWSGTPIMYDYLFSGDSICDVEAQSSENYTTVPFIISGYTNSSLNDLSQYGNKSGLLKGKYKPGMLVTGGSGTIGTVIGETSDYISYEISGITYFDYIDGPTVFITQSSGITPDSIVCSALTKNEVLLNVISETEVQSDVFIERGKLSPLESMMRIGEVDNVGDLVKYGYKFFTLINE
jgi:hypothetical protein